MLGERGETLVVIIVIGLAVILIFVFPVMSMLDRADDITQLSVEQAVTEFVDSVLTTGKIDPDKYDVLVIQLGSTGNAYEIEMMARIQDENPGKKVTQVQSNKVGENEYYDLHTSQLMDMLYTENGDKQDVYLKKGDYFATAVRDKNASSTNPVDNWFYSSTGTEAYSIAAQRGGLIQVDGAN